MRTIILGASSLFFLAQSLELGAQTQINETGLRSGASLSCAQASAEIAHYLSLADEVRHIEALEEANTFLEQSLLMGQRLSRDDLMAMEYLQFETDAVMQIAKSEQHQNQSAPFSAWRLPKAGTGFYVPHYPGKGKWVEPSMHEGLLILLPGMGSSISEARSLFDIAGTFHGKKSKGGKNRDSVKLDHIRDDGKPFRLASFALDITLQGFQRGAPKIFASERGSIAVLRHFVLILKHLYPELPISVAGRSQGGLIGIAYNKYYNDLTSVVAMNPTPTDEPTLDAMLRVVASNLEKIFSDSSVGLCPDVWNACAHFSKQFEAYDQSGHAPTLLVIGRDDDSYHDDQHGRTNYESFVQHWVSGQPERREVFEFDGGHNLWNRRDGATYRAVVEAMARWVHDQIYP